MGAWHLHRVGSPTTSDAPPRVVHLDLSTDADILDSPVGSGALRYLVRCALDGDTRAVVLHGEEQIAFYGSLGLAPAWVDRALTTGEERWVSACLYALTNKFGKPVEVSLRGTHAKLDTEFLSEEERQNFTLHEGGFFGNFFAAQPTAFACTGEGLREYPEATVFRERVCAIPAPSSGPNGELVSKCGFVLTGSCSATSSVVVPGSEYYEIVHVYLRPD